MLSFGSQQAPLHRGVDCLRANKKTQLTALRSRALLVKESLRKLLEVAVPGPLKLIPLEASSVDPLWKRVQLIPLEASSVDPFWKRVQLIPFELFQLIPFGSELSQKG